MQVDSSEFTNWISSSDSMFDIVVCNSDDVPSNVRIIGPEQINHDLKKAFPERLGSFPTQKAQRLLQRVAGRVADRIAAKNADQFDVSVAGLRYAWFHPVFSELASLVPIRHLARSYSRNSKRQLFAIRIDSNSFVALNSWNTNFVEPLYLACELRRRNVPVFLILAEDLDQPKLSFQLSDRWLPKGYPRFIRDMEFKTVMCKNAVRRWKFLSEQTNTKKRMKPGLFSRITTSRFRSQACRFEIELEDGPSVDGMRVYTAPQGATTLDRAFVDLLGPLTARVADWYRSELASKPVQIAHVADHASLEGGLLGAEVVRNGGNIHVWPHSANVVHIDAHDPESVARVTMAVRSTGTHWAKKFGAEKMVVDPNFILKKASSHSDFIDSQPIHVVLFAGSHFLRRVPLFRYEGHKATWTRTLDTLSKADVEFVVKHKSVWETRDWIKRRTTESSKLPFSNVHASNLKLPNMIYLCISLTSTAIFEGIARGIPGFVVRDIPIDETPHYDPHSVPCVASDQLGTFLEDVSSKANWEALRERQRAWFQRETIL